MRTQAYPLPVQGSGLLLRKVAELLLLQVALLALLL